MVLCGYPGYLDILVLLPLAKLRGEQLALDAFIPLYETIAMDRKLVAPQGLLAECCTSFRAYPAVAPIR